MTALLQLFAPSPEVGLDGDQLVSGPLSDPVVALKILDSFEADSLNEPDAVIDSSTRSVAIAMLSLSVSISLIKTKMRR